MKIHILFLSLALVVSSCSSWQKISLTGTQSMGIIGQGPGRDAAINPYAEDPTAMVIKNLGPAPVSIRIEEKRLLVQTIDLEAQRRLRFPLSKDEMVFFDTDGMSDVKLKFIRIRETTSLQK